METIPDYNDARIDDLMKNLVDGEFGNGFLESVVITRCRIATLKFSTNILKSGPPGSEIQQLNE
ncbi:MAG: hypothetical protein ACTSU5_16585 [Promethearchaeota archaeon]